MADVNLPSLDQLAQMEFMSPLANQQAQRQVDLATQFQNQNLAMGQEDLKSKTLANAFQVANDPLKLQKGQLDNEGLTAENIIKKINAQQREQLAPEELAAKRSAFVKQLSDDKLSQALTDAKQMMLSDDPNLAKKGQDLWMRSSDEQSTRMKHKDTMEVHAADRASAERVAQIGAGATLGAARINADSRVSAAKARNKGFEDFDAAVAAGKITPAKASVYWTSKAQASQDPEEQAAFFAKAQQYEKLSQSVNPFKPGVDIPAAAGLQSTQAPTAFAPVAPGAAKQAPSKPALPPGWTMK